MDAGWIVLPSVNLEKQGAPGLDPVLSKNSSGSQAVVSQGMARRSRRWKSVILAASTIIRAFKIAGFQGRGPQTQLSTKEQLGARSSSWTERRSNSS
jgi:hypothetical protein